MPLSPITPRPYRLLNPVQHYAWGTRDAEAFIPRLLGTPAEPGRPYAELWMGAHPKAPSQAVVGETTVPLDQWIASYSSDLLGPAVSERFGGRLPFLFKVLSAGEALSIQAHPDKRQAERLHARDPEHYPDDNHKPEIAIALDSLTALMGMKPADGLARALERYPELAGFLGSATVDKLHSVLPPSTGMDDGSRSDAISAVRDAFAALIQGSVERPREMAGAVDELAGRLATSSAPLQTEEQQFLQLRRQYGSADVGLFALFMLNWVRLERGQGVYIPAGVPHAYLKGNIIECMANSDNVIRVGLTPKFKDASSLVEILNADPHAVLRLGKTQAGVAGGGFDERELETLYQAPVQEFQVCRWMIPADARVRRLTGNKPAIVLVTQGWVGLEWEVGGQGDSLTLTQGQSALIPANLPHFSLFAGGEAPAEVFAAQVP